MRVAVVAAVLCLSVLNLSAVSSAQAAIRQTTNIAPQGLGPALQALAKERNFQLVYRSEFVKDLNTQGASGELTSDEAMTQLLSGTGLAFRYLDERTVTVFPISATGTSSTSVVPVMGGSAQVQDEPVSGKGPPNGFWNRIRLAQSDQSPQRANASSASENQEARRSRAIGTDDQVDLGEIVVTGTNIRGVYPSSSPVEIYTAEDIARTGATTTEQFVQKLPQNLGTRTQFAANAVLNTPNTEGVNSVDLRGLGVGTTLTLLNGRRLALAESGRTADISMIPANAIDRVEVLTDGASAIYGSDAIGGVVNFVLREDFDGAETRLSYGGVTDGNLRQEGEFAQTFGRSWNSGHALASYTYLSASALERDDRAFAQPAGPGTLTPHDQRQSALVTVSQDVGDRLAFSGDFLYSSRDTKNDGTDITAANPLSYIFFQAHSETEQYFANLGAEYEFTEDLSGRFSASYSEANVDSFVSGTFFNFNNLTTTSNRNSNYSGLDLTGLVDGTLFSLPAGPLRFSLGGGYLDEDYLGLRSDGVASTRSLGRLTTYAFGELLAPIVGPDQAVPLMHRLELSVAARYTNYEDSSEPAIGRDFGDNVSPKIGVLWSPTPSVNLRATYGESFRAPSLSELDPTAAINRLRGNLPVVGVPSTILIVQGASANLDPETAESYTVGFDFNPVAHRDFHLGVTYFNIEYDDRIAMGDSTFGSAPIANPSAFTDVFFRPSSAAQIEQLLRASRNTLNTSGISLSDLTAASNALFGLPQFWILDLRLRNLALSQVNGVDVSIRDRFDTPLGELMFGGQVTRILDYTQQISENAPVQTVVDVVTQPVDFRGRVYANLSRGGLDATIGLNYVDDYSNPFALSGEIDVESWTTVDLNLSYDFGTPDAHGLLRGLRLNLSVQNVFDEDPPGVTRGTGGPSINLPVGFDPTNANPLGRLVVIGVTKTW